MGLNIITEMVLKFFTEKNIKKITERELPKRNRKNSTTEMNCKNQKRVAERNIAETENMNFHKLEAEKTFWPK